MDDTNKVKPVEDGMHTVTPHLVCPGALDAIAFYERAFKRAVEAGAKARMAPAEMFWGDRYGVVEAPFGHRWAMATHIRDVSPEEMAEAMLQGAS